MQKGFSYKIKKELSEMNNLAKKDEVRYEFYGYLSSSNIIIDKNVIKYSTENEYNINRFAKLLRNVDINNYKIDIQGKVYTITIKNLEVPNNIEQIVNNSNEECDRAFIRGLFLGAGSINNPQNKYHLEIKIPNKDLINKAIEILKKYQVNVKSIEHGIYIKDGEEISRFLAFIGASKSVLEFEQVRVQREMNNKINRLVNCKTANLNKVINASVEQINAIKKLKESGKFIKMDKPLQELAELRLEYPDMSLSELGKKMEKPLGKSGVNYRMKKIIELAK